MSTPTLTKLLDVIDALIRDGTLGPHPTRSLSEQNTALRQRVNALSSANESQPTLALRDNNVATPSILEEAIALEARFASTHPLAEKLMREFIDTLSRAGI